MLWEPPLVGCLPALSRGPLCAQAARGLLLGTVSCRNQGVIIVRSPQLVDVQIRDELPSATQPVIAPHPQGSTCLFATPRAFVLRDNAGAQPNWN